MSVSGSRPARDQSFGREEVAGGGGRVHEADGLSGSVLEGFDLGVGAHAGHRVVAAFVLGAFAHEPDELQIDAAVVGEDVGERAVLRHVRLPGALRFDGGGVAGGEVVLDLDIELTLEDAQRQGVVRVELGAVLGGDHGNDEGLGHLAGFAGAGVGGAGARGEREEDAARVVRARVVRR